MILVLRILAITMNLCLPPPRLALCFAHAAQP